MFDTRTTEWWGDQCERVKKFGDMFIVQLFWYASRASDGDEQTNWIITSCTEFAYKNSSGDEIANVNFFYNIAHVEASAYAHWTSS